MRDSNSFSQIVNFFNPKEKLTFLVGAGCSLDSPTKIPNTQKIMETIIKHICVSKEVKKIKEYKVIF